MSGTHSVVFFGTPEFAVPSLEALIKNAAFDVPLVVTQPDKLVGRQRVLTPPPVKVVAERYGIPVLQPKNVNHQFPNVQPDFFVVVAYGQIFSEELLNIPRIAAVNLHASLLPKWRGASPIQHAILTGDTETGVTVQQMIRHLDAGPILGQRRIPLDRHSTYIDVRDRLKTIGADLLIDTLRSPLRPVPQDERQVTICKKLSRGDAALDPEFLSAEEIDRRARSLNPWPGVTCMINGVPLKILATSLTGLPDAYPLRCAKESIIHLVSVQEPGKRAMSGAAWARGKKVSQES